MIKVDESSSDAEKPDEFLYERALQSFDDYVLKFEELWEKYEGDPDRDRKIADELGGRLVHDEGDDAEVIDEGSTEGADLKTSATEYPEPLWWSDPLIIRAKDLCVAVSELNRVAKPDLSDSSRLDELQLTLVQGMAKLGDALHGVIEGKETRDPELLVALLKRSLSKYHFALETLKGMDWGNVPAATLETWRAEILGIRQEIVDAMSRFRQMQ